LRVRSCAGRLLLVAAARREAEQQRDADEREKWTFHRR
jgi:hypothetical protein